MTVALLGKQNKFGLTTPLMWSLNPATETVDLMLDSYCKSEVDTAINALQPTLTFASPTNGFPLFVDGSIKGLVANSPLTLTSNAVNFTLFKQ